MKNAQKTFSPTFVNTSVTYDNDRPILKIDDFKQDTADSNRAVMTEKEKRAWQKRLKAIVENNEYYRQFCN